jgi:two-component system chemotaxis response regulator CheY
MEGAELPRRERVLLVADDLFLRKLVREQAEILGLSVQEASTPSRALDRLRDAPPDLVLLDTWIEHGNGLPFLEALRNDPVWRRMPVLLIGSESRPDVREAARDLGAVGPLAVRRMEEILGWIQRTLAVGS